jgi:hypothetical protein
MNLVRTSMFRTILFGVFAALAFESCANARPCTVVEVEPVRGLTVQQVGQLATQQLQTNAQHTALLWSFDVEDRPKKRSMMAVAFLLISTGDIGGQPIGALIWSSESTGAKLVKDTHGGFEIILGDATQGCSKTTVSIGVSDNGTVVADKKSLGQVQ